MSTFARPEAAFVRGVPDSYADCLRSDATARVDVARARAQHEAHVEVMRQLGVAVHVVATDAAFPDACFIEDTAVVLGSVAVLTRPGAASRRGEVAVVGDALAPHRQLRGMRAPATLDGGDVLRVGDTLFVGLSTRTNADGAAMLGRVADEEGLSVAVVDVRGGLHLKSACTLAGPRTLVFDPAVIGDEALRVFEGAGLACLEAGEPAGANVLLLGDVVLVSAAAPRTAARIAAGGATVRVLDVDEMHAGDGALTCLSLRLPAVGCWST